MSKALNELKKATMASYLSKAGSRVRSGTKIGLDFEKDAYNDMRTVNKHHPNVYTPGFEKDPEKLAAAEKSMNVNFDLSKTFKRDAANRIKGIARAGRLLAKEEHDSVGEAYTKVLSSPSREKKEAAHKASANDPKSHEFWKKLGEKPPGYRRPAWLESSKAYKARTQKEEVEQKEETIVEGGKNPYGPGYKLVDKDGNELSVGHKFMYGRSDEKPKHHEITGWQSGEQRGNSSSSGRVAVRVGKGKKAYDTEYFPHVFDMKVVKEETVKEGLIRKVFDRLSKTASVGTKLNYRRPRKEDPRSAKGITVASGPRKNVPGDPSTWTDTDFEKEYGYKHAKNVKEETVNEVSVSTLSKVATARWKQAQTALAAKDFGGYVKKKAKSMKAADATVATTGWSPEDDKKNEEVAPVVSPQEKYRQIKEARMAKAQKSTTTHHNFYIAHEDTDEAAGVLAKHKIPHSVADHSSAPVDHSVISVRHKHYENAKAAFKKNGIDFGGR